MKRFSKASCVFALLFALCNTVACSKGNSVQPDIVLTGFAQYDWAMEILGNNPAQLEVKYLLDNGIDIHNYQPSPAHIAQISTCSLFVYTADDEWISSALNSPKNGNREVINLFDLLESTERILVDDDHDHDHEEEHDHEYDEHIWLSIRLSKRFVESICSSLCAIDAENAEH